VCRKVFKHLLEKEVGDGLTMKKNGWVGFFCGLIASAVIMSGTLFAFSATITVERGCESTYFIGEEIAFHITLSDNAYVTVSEVAIGKSYDIVRNTYKSKGSHEFKKTVSGPEGTHTLCVEARHLYGEEVESSCSFYVKERVSDSDRDGIPDNRDKCDNPGCTVVDAQGCPRDSDNDGVNDCDDSCDNPGCTVVDSAGCPDDSDNDGVNDCDDDCLHEPGDPSNRGCPQPSDKDHDGIRDQDDSCDNPGCTVVDSAGCPRDSDNDGVMMIVCTNQEILLTEDAPIIPFYRIFPIIGG
jgi:hypothetical protein